MFASWGQQGTWLGEFGHPFGIAADGERDRVYVVTTTTSSTEEGIESRYSHTAGVTLARVRWPSITHSMLPSGLTAGYS